MQQSKKTLTTYYQDPDTGEWRMGWQTGFPRQVPASLLALINKIIYTIKTRKGSNAAFPDNGCHIEDILKMSPGLDDTEVRALLTSSIQDVETQIKQDPIDVTTDARLNKLYIEKIYQDSDDKTVYRMIILVITESGEQATLRI